MFHNQEGGGHKEKEGLNFFVGGQKEKGYLTKEEGGRGEGVFSKFLA